MKPEDKFQTPSEARLDDDLAEVIRQLTADDARRLWSFVINKKPDLKD